MNNIDCSSIISYLHAGIVLRILLLLILGIPSVRMVSKAVDKFLERKFSRHLSILVANTLYYVGMSSILVAILHDLGFHISAVMGAAGIAGIAIGFAAQTSISHIISGFFVLVERPFAIGDFIEWQNVKGTVHSIDLFSTKIRTSANTLVRIGNADLLKQQLINTTHFSTRRIMFDLQIEESQYSAALMTQIQQVIEKNKICLSAPAPQIVIAGIIKDSYSTQTRVKLQVQVWVNKEKVSLAKNELLAEWYALSKELPIEILMIPLD